MDNTKLTFPCVDCITYPICRNILLKKLDCDPSIVIDIITLYYITVDYLVPRCSLLEIYIIKKHHRESIYVRYDEKIANNIFKIFKLKSKIYRRETE